MSGPRQRVVMLNLPEAHGIDIEFENLTYDVTLGFRGQPKAILKGVSGCFKSGELTAIMGPSGAGKSSLLNILTGFHDGDNARVKYVNSTGGRGGFDGSGNGDAVEKGDGGRINGGKGLKNAEAEKWKNQEAYRKESCYIQQFDQLHGMFTVMEMMEIAANLKLGNNLDRATKKKIIMEILKELDLMKTRETRCERLSGGQKKRLSIALELIDNPPVMFLDEPTTGLDSSSSLQCIAMLRRLARGGRTIVCTIHQPSATIYELFDHVYILAEGRCLYQGSPTSTVSYLGSTIGLVCPRYHNPADYMIEVACKEYGNFTEQLVLAASESCQLWRARGFSSIISEEKSKMNGTKSITEGATLSTRTATVLINPPPEFTRFWILLNRYTVQLYRDWTVARLKLVLHFFVGILLGLLYVNCGDDGSKSIQNVGFFFVSVIYLWYTSALPAVLRFPTELPVLKKEKFNNWYQLKTYYLASLIAHLPMQILLAIVYTSVSYVLSGQPLDSKRFFMFLAVTIATNVMAESVGLVIGTFTNSTNGTFFCAVLTAVLLGLSGFLIFFDHMPIIFQYVSYLNYLRYSMEGSLQAIYGFNRDKLSCPTTETYCHYRIPDALLKEFGVSEGKYWIDILILLLGFVFLRIFGYCTLKRKLATA